MLMPGNLSLTASDSRLAHEMMEYDAFADLPWLAPDVISQKQSVSSDAFVFIATNRSRKGWITSMLEHQSKGGVPLRVWYGMMVAGTRT
eukprot:1808857-Prymnesium_polylepis.1